jgi:Ca2+-binding RTX toxin-like protein
MTGTTGRDTLFGDAGEDTVSGNEGDDILYGGNDDDRVNGGGGMDTVYGGTGDDILYGIDGNDRLYGGTGNDVLDGGDGFDLLSGGSGNDRFDFNKLSDAPVLEVGAESINDFGDVVGNNDVIDISTIDANPLQAGNQAFSFIGSADFTAIGQISFNTLVRSTVLQLNTDADADSEAQIFVGGSGLVFNANDFIL